MSEMSPEYIIAFTTILISGIGIIVGTAIPSIVEGRAVLKALDGIIRQLMILLRRMAYLLFRSFHFLLLTCNFLNLSFS